MKFLYDEYIRLVSELRDEGYHFSGYHNYKESEKSVILRHDVDMSLEAALQMAMLEREMDVHSTYFILISSDFYNIFSKKSMEYINKIKEAGHDIGLHFDERKYEGNWSGGNIENAIVQEAEIMEMALGFDIRSVSMHRPSKLTLDADYRIADGKIVNSYGTEFFHEFEYISDSRREWHKDVWKILHSGQYTKLHILVHPIWYDEKEVEMAEKLKQFCLAAVEERYNTLNENLRGLQDILDRQELIDCVIVDRERKNDAKFRSDL